MALVRHHVVLFNPPSLLWTMRLAWPLRGIARWRVGRHDYRLPGERRIIERIRPRARLS